MISHQIMNWLIPPRFITFSSPIASLKHTRRENMEERVQCFYLYNVFFSSKNMFHEVIAGLVKKLGRTAFCAVHPARDHPHEPLLHWVRNVCLSLLQHSQELIRAQNPIVVRIKQVKDHVHHILGKRYATNLVYRSKAYVRCITLYQTSKKSVVDIRAQQLFLGHFLRASHSLSHS